MPRPPIADTIAATVRQFVGDDLPVRIRAWDGSEAGPDGATVAVVRNRRALRRLLWRPDELGLARAYVTGDLDVEGDLEHGFRRIWAFARDRDRSVHVGHREQLAAAGRALRLGIVGLPPRAPVSEAKVTGRLHSRSRDRAVIAHHYDLSNDFYSLILDEHMAYSCAYFTSDAPGYTLADAQRDKLDLVCRKLALAPGMRLLDVGCGWGSLSIHAARHHGARVTGVTLSREQLDFARKRAADAGVQDLVEFRLQDYRDVADGPYDVASSIEMGEHVGAEHYPMFVATVQRLLRPEGRFLVQQMSRAAGNAPGGGPFIEAYIAPDMHMRPVGETVGLLEAGGFEVRDVHALREHYVRTAQEWRANFESRWHDVVALVGEEVARVWRLYLVGGTLAFEERRMGVDQILAVKPSVDGRAGLASVRSW
jgi:cyclopropane-fatty-acyl-phospholipid synthase